MDLNSIIKLYHPDGRRSNVGVDEDYILANVDFKKDLLTAPKDLLRQFVSPKSLPEFEKMDFDFEFTASTTNEDLSGFMIKSINKLSNINGFEFDRRLENILPKNIRGQGLFFEQYTLPLTNLSDSQFEEIYKNFVEEAKKNNPAYLSFVSKSDINKTIIFTNNVKIIYSESINLPLQVSYSQRGKGLVDFSSVVTSKAGNPVWTHLARSLFKAIDKVNANLVIDRGSNKTTILKSTFFKKEELSEEDIAKEKELDDIFKISANVDAFDNNKNRGSMSPNSSKEYIDKKDANGELLEIQKEGISNINNIINEAGTENVEDEIKKEDITEKEEKVEDKLVENNIEESIEVVEVENVKEVEKPIMETTQIVEPKKEEEDSKVVEKNKTTNNDVLDKVMSELDLMTSKELLSIEQAFERKKIEAKELSFKMLNDFKTNIKLGGTIQSNLEKINQTYRDNEFAVSLFGVLVKTEILKSVAKDEIINKLNANLLVLNDKLDSVKNNYENLISVHTTKIKTLEEQITSVLKEKSEVDTEFDEYVDEATKQLQLLRNEIEDANFKLKDYEDLKSVSADRDKYIEKLETKSNILEKEFLSLQGQLKDYDTLKNLSALQGKNITSLENENVSLKNQIDLQGNSIKELEKTLENLRSVNLQMADKLEEYESKLGISGEIKKELYSINKTKREINKKEEILIKNDKEIKYLRTIELDEIKDKLFTAKEMTPEWHRLNLIKLDSVNFQTDVWKKYKNSHPEVYEQFVSEINGLTKAGLTYKTTDGTYKLKEKAKNVIFENLNMSFEELGAEFKKFTYQKSDSGSQDSDAQDDSKDFKRRFKLNK